MKILPAAFAALCILLAGCDKRPVVESEKYVVLHYRGTLADGSEFDSSEGREPLEFIFGMGMMIPGFEKGITGMRAGDKKTIQVNAAEAYGPYDDSLVAAIPRTEIPAELAPKAGMQIMVESGYGPMPVLIKEVTDKEILIDYNPPLAGKDLTFDVEIVEIRDATAEELAPLKAQSEKPVPGQ